MHRLNLRNVSLPPIAFEVASVLSSGVALAAVRIAPHLLLCILSWRLLSRAARLSYVERSGGLQVVANGGTILCAFFSRATDSLERFRQLLIGDSPIVVLLLLF